MTRSTGESLSILVPCFNEAATLETALRRLWSVDIPIPYDLIVIDDGSTDGSAGIASRLADQSPRPLRVVGHSENRGKTAALRTGLEHATGTLTLVYDADLEYDPADIPRLLAPLLDDRADAVYGSRFQSPERRVLFFWHALGNRLVTALADLFANLNLTDMETCFKVVRTDILKKMRIRSERFGFEPEVTVKLGKLGCRVFEVPIRYSGRSYDEGKKIRWWDAVRAVGTILRAGLLESPAAGPEASARYALGKMGPYHRELLQRVEGGVGESVLLTEGGSSGLYRQLVQQRRLVIADSDEQAVRRLDTRFGHRPNVEVVEWGPGRGGGPDGRFDTVFCSGTLERLEEDGRAVTDLADRLAEGGHLILVLPAHPRLFGPLDRSMGRHRRYSRVQVRELVEGAGLNPVSVKAFNAPGAAGWAATGGLLRRRRIRTWQVRLFLLLMPLIRLERLLPPPFGLSWIVVARRPGEVRPAHS
ncbi:MAG: glycosyltransferase [bacterium]